MVSVDSIHVPIRGDGARLGVDGLSRLTVRAPDKAVLAANLKRVQHGLVF
jgi:hypothetical protein